MANLFRRPPFVSSRSRRFGLFGRETRTPVLGLTITAPVGSVGSVYHAVSDCRRLSEEFTAEGSVVLRVTAEVGQVDEVRRRIQDATKGAAEVVEEVP
ncbi:unnamed protein product [Ectocarpus sp. 8 AP-2014]